MRLVFILAGKSFNFYDVNKLKNTNTKLVAIVNHGHQDVVSNEINQFDEVIIVEDERKIGPLYIANIDEVIKHAENLSKKYDTKDLYVVCPDEGNILVAAHLREHFSISGMKSSDAIKFRSKVEMKKVLSENNIPVPRYELIESNDLLLTKEYFDHLKNKFGNTFIIKPTSAAAGFGVHRIDSFESLSRIAHDIIDKNILYEAEELIHGDLYHCDIGFCKRKVIFKECAQYNTNNFDFDSKNNLIGSIVLSDQSCLKQKIIRFCINILMIMGGFDGFYHCEVFVRNNELVFLEVGARLPGALIAKMYSQMYEENLFNLDFLIQTDPDIDFFLERKHYGMWFIYFVYQNAYVRKIKLLENIDINWNFHENDILKINEDGYRFIGQYLYMNDNHQMVNDRFQKLKDLGLVKLLDLEINNIPHI